MENPGGPPRHWLHAPAHARLQSNELDAANQRPAGPDAANSPSTANFLEFSRLPAPRWEMEVAVRIPEKNKKPGVCYAVTNEGVELPVIDVTHKEFALNLSPEELAARHRKFMGDVNRKIWMPRFLYRQLLRFLLRKSVLMQGIRKASDRFLSGMNTYLLKIGPGNLGEGYIGRGDRQIAGSYPVLAVRLRLQETARMIAEGFTGPLSSRPAAPLHLFNIGGGHAADSLNSLIVAKAADARLLEGRRIFIHVLDLEADAPDFGRRSLAALLAPGAPLHGLDVAFSHVRYNWGETGVLRAAIAGLEAGDKVVTLSTEGALFEYGSDGDILSNLALIREATPGDSTITGSVTRVRAEFRNHYGATRIPVVHRGLPRFSALVRQAGWAVEKAAEGPFSDVVRLARA
jgi:hypothetical protein